MKLLRELGTRRQKFGILKPPYSPTARDVQADSWEKLLQYSYGLLAAVILWVYSYKQCLKYGVITAQIDHDKHKFDSMYCCTAALQIVTI